MVVNHVNCEVELLNVINSRVFTDIAVRFAVNNNDNIRIIALQ